MLKKYVRKRRIEKSHFCGGCFWCMQQPFEGLEGVIEAFVEYTGGHKKDPSYAEVLQARPITGNL